MFVDICLSLYRWQTKPKMSIHGDLYYEGKEFETRLREKKPGDLSDELRRSLGMPTGLVCLPPSLPPSLIHAPDAVDRHCKAVSPRSQ